MIGSSPHSLCFSHSVVGPTEKEDAMFKRILRLVVVGWIVGMVAGAVAALQARRRIGPDSPESADDIVASAIFGPLDYHSTATNLRGGTLELWYGGGVLDLRDATLAPGRAKSRAPRP